jgi:hypothetical protein
MKRLAVLAFVAALSLATTAHIGSPNVVFEGLAG